MDKKIYQSDIFVLLSLIEGVSLSAISKSIAKINPDIPESKKLKSWYESEGKETSMASVGAGMTPSPTSGGRSMYTDRVSISHITSNPSLGEDKVVQLLITRSYLLEFFLIAKTVDLICCALLGSLFFST